MSPATHHHPSDAVQRHAELALVTIATVYGAERRRLTTIVPIDAFVDDQARHYWQRLTDCDHVHVTPTPHLDALEPDRTIERDPTTCGAILLRDEIDGLFDAPKYVRQILTHHAITLAERAHLERLDAGHDPTASVEELQTEIAEIRRSAP